MSDALSPVCITMLSGKTYSTGLKLEDVEDCVLGGELVEVDSGEDGIALYVNPRAIVLVACGQAV